jgi:PAB1-binding protein PBP1
MALSKVVKIDKLEIVGDYKSVQCREATVVSEDGVELSRSFHRHVLHPDSDISGEPQETQDICNAVWTDEVKAAWTAFQEAQAVPEAE